MTISALSKLEHYQDSKQKDANARQLNAIRVWKTLFKVPGPQISSGIYLVHSEHPHRSLFYS